MASDCLLSNDVQGGHSAWHHLLRYLQRLNHHCIRWTAAAGNTSRACLEARSFLGKALTASTYAEPDTDSTHLQLLMQLLKSPAQGIPLLRRHLYGLAGQLLQPQRLQEARARSAQPSADSARTCCRTMKSALQAGCWWAHGCERTSVKCMAMYSSCSQEQTGVLLQPQHEAGATTQVSLICVASLQRNWLRSEAAGVCRDGLTVPAMHCLPHLLRPVSRTAQSRYSL